MKIKKAIPRSIIIEPSHNGGFVVKTGCAVFAFVNKEGLIGSLDEYLRDPKKMETDYNKTIGGPAAEVPGPQPPTPEGDPR